MSPYGRYYLSLATYRPGWREPFEGWRMSWYIEHISRTWAPTGTGRWSSVAKHLDAIASHLRGG